MKVRTRKETQISAEVSQDTKELIDRFVRASGLKKGYVLESALRHHIQAMQELPHDIIISPTLVLTSESAEQLVKRLKRPAKPTSRLRTLMKRPHADPGAQA
jgi:uncharacterized protein (DUF1778 family)